MVEIEFISLTVVAAFAAYLVPGIVFCLLFLASTAERAIAKSEVVPWFGSLTFIPQ